MIYITTAKTEKITMSKKMLALTKTDLQIKKLLKVLAQNVVVTIKDPWLY